MRLVAIELSLALVKLEWTEGSEDFFLAAKYKPQVLVIHLSNHLIIVN